MAKENTAPEKFIYVIYIASPLTKVWRRCAKGK